ncbi:MAG: cell division protein FtsA [Deltaproteobacteria bacterium]|nr:cell division protein FtsA [Deltaproteobacteria bacterium]
MAKKRNLIVGLDIGTTKTCAIIGEMTQTGIDIIGLGTHPSEGIRKGVVVNIDATVESIKGAVDEAEHMSGCEIGSVYAGIAGEHIKGQNSLGIVGVKGREVDEDDVERAIEQSMAIAMPADREILHTLPQYYVVDEQDGVKDPVGMSGVRLEAKVHIVTGAVSSVQNIVKSVTRVGLDLNGIVLEPLAAGEAVLSKDERDLGVAVIDIGGGTTDVAVFSDGNIKHTAILPIGGNYVTSDIAAGLRTPIADAEKIKIKYGCAFSPMIQKDEVIEVPSVGGREPREVSRQILGRVIEARVDEILRLAYKEIVKSEQEERLAAGVVLTGGTALLDGIPELAEQIYDMPVRRGSPQEISGLTDIVNSPLYATAVGLVIHGSKNLSRGQRGKSDKVGFGGGLFQRIKDWILENF